MSQEKSWEEQAREWARFARSPEHDHFFWHFNGPRFLDLVPPPGRLTLDVACGEGRLGRLLHERGHRVFAVDASPTLARMAHQSDGQTVVLGDAGELPLADGSADLVTAFMCLHDVLNLDRAVAEIARVLAHGGRFCIALAHPMRSAGGFHTKESNSPFQLDCYFDARPWLWSSQHTGMRITLPGVHRPLEAYTRALEQEGFLLETLREPRPAKHQIVRYPESARWQRIPCFVHIRAIKGPSAN